VFFNQQITKAELLLREALEHKNPSSRLWDLAAVCVVERALTG
jgi:hypothetical protein